MRRVALWAVSIWICGWGASGPGVVVAGHISGGFVDDVRNPMQKEGYLNFRTTNHGEEYTGHTDRTGRDHADNWITVRPVRLIDSAGVKPTKAEEADIDAEFEFIRKIYAQAGIAVRREATVEQNLAVTWANFNFDARVTAANAQNNTGGVMNLFYAKEFDVAANGLSVSPSQVGGLSPGGITINRPYSFVRDNRVNNTSAHELGHQLLNGNALWKQDNPATESTDTTNLMFRTGAESAADLDDVGQRLSPTVGGHDIIEHQKDGALQEQIARMHENGGPRNGIPAFVQHGNYHDTHGDKADFDWVSDQRLIETLAAGGNGADHGAGVDFMIWEIADILASKHIGPDKDAHFHTNLGELARPKFDGPSFKTVDIFSNINRYADNDIDPATGAVSNVSKALDYLTPQFSTDMTTWVSGELVNVFIKGWNKPTTIDDYVARWRTDIDAKFVRLSAAGVGVVGHDGNTQIDAIIATTGFASAVPEPGTIVLAGIGAALLLAHGARRRRRGR